MPVLETVAPNWPTVPQVRALCTTRSGGVGRAPYASFNLATHVGDDDTTVTANRARLNAALELPSSPLWLSQVHAAALLDSDCVTETTPPTADAAYSRARRRVCAVLTADCLPILLTNTTGTCVAAVHAGWRGLLTGIIPSVLQRLSTTNETWLAWIGPAISAPAYEIGTEVRQLFLSADESYERYFVAHGARWKFDLASLAATQLQRAGVDLITRFDGCTASDAARFFSYRRDGVTGRMASLIWIK
ncbi:MAG: peptidoglycan editing factor PgeF [Gammaproteobacteria bacterium]|nr:peptidoglycan editing factor PgeF [Gammaproteobacteria bacterium]